ncbi:hypothetical protein HDU93_010089 [Gonapodya sp. JEL0774]|nr:hypothetical protein HDU93_010089 [Gonapodya sp. JEL0774]
MAQTESQPSLKADGSTLHMLSQTTPMQMWSSLDGRGKAKAAALILTVVWIFFSLFGGVFYGTVNKTNAPSFGNQFDVNSQLSLLQREASQLRFQVDSLHSLTTDLRSVGGASSLLDRLKALEQSLDTKTRNALDEMRRAVDSRVDSYEQSAIVRQMNYQTQVDDLRGAISTRAEALQREMARLEHKYGRRTTEQGQALQTISMELAALSEDVRRLKVGSVAKGTDRSEKQPRMSERSERYTETERSERHREPEQPKRYREPERSERFRETERSELYREPERSERNKEPEGSQRLRDTDQADRYADTNRLNRPIEKNRPGATPPAEPTERTQAQSSFDGNIFASFYSKVTGSFRAQSASSDSNGKENSVPPPKAFVKNGFGSRDAPNQVKSDARGLKKVWEQTTSLFKSSIIARPAKRPNEYTDSKSANDLSKKDMNLVVLSAPSDVEETAENVQMYLETMEWVNKGWDNLTLWYLIGLVTVSLWFPYGLPSTGDDH